jgi:tripartite-type tricarboxylate transporter receptor subunit TctC
MGREHWARGATALAMASLAGTFPQHAPAADFTLAGKTLTVTVSGGVGGGLDAYIRTFLPYLTKRLPGNPPAVVQNLPGGGGVQGVQSLYNLAAKDGSAIGSTPAGPIKEPLMGSGKVNYDLRKFNWVGSLTTEDTVCLMWHTSPIKTLKDAQTREVAISATGAASNSTLGPLLFNDLIGTKFKPISGYDGGTSMLALERQEVDGRCTTMNSVRAAYPQWIRDKSINTILRVSDVDVPEFPNAPKLMDLLKTEADRSALAFFQAPDEIQNPIMLPPDVPAEVVAAYRKAFGETIADKEYQEEAKKRRQSIVARSGEEVQKTIEAMYKTSPEVIERVKRATTLTKVEEKK